MSTVREATWEIYRLQYLKAVRQCLKQMKKSYLEDLAKPEAVVYSSHPSGFSVAVWMTWMGEEGLELLPEGGQKALPEAQDEETGGS